jgi:hypothetical protein
MIVLFFITTYYKLQYDRQQRVVKAMAEVREDPRCKGKICGECKQLLKALGSDISAMLKCSHV